MEALDNKCPACGAKITFNPENQMWDCEYCGSKFTLDEMKKHSNASSDDSNSNVDKFKKLDGLDVYTCKNCGAEVMADETTTSTFCVYCGSTAILKDRINDGIAPTKIIPFKKVKDEATKAFISLSKGRPLMPKLFNNKENVKKVSGVYIPFWKYDLNVNGNLDFDCKDIKTWSDYNYNYTKTDTYLAKRNADLNFNNILVDGSSRFNDDLMDSLEPFRLEELVEYNHAYLSGFLAEKYDVKSEDAVTRANKRAMNSSIDVVRESVVHQTKVPVNNSLNITCKYTDYILLPVWMVNIKYKEKDYTFAMNGQTGEIVGNIPLDMMKTILISIGIFIMSFIVCFLIMSL